MTYLADTDRDTALAPLQAAACIYRIALGPRAGQKVLSLQTVSSQAAPPTEQRCVSAQGFSLHAEVRCAGDVVWQLKTPYQDGTTHIVMSPLELMQHLAALVPRPRLHLICFHGVLAPNAKLRPEIVPGGPVNANNTANDHRNAPHHSAPARISWARLPKRVFAIDSEQYP
jgi:hypothetical protein